MPICYAFRGLRTRAVRSKGVSELHNLNAFSSCFPVPRAESHGDAALQRARRRGAGLRAGAQVTRPGADPVPGQEALQRGDTAGPGAHGVALPEGPPGGRRLSHQPHEVEPRPCTLT